MDTRIRDVARLAQVSPATVSLVLNNKPGIGEETRERVRRVAKELDYPGAKSAKVTHSGTDTLSFLHITRRGPEFNRDFDVFIADYIEGLGREARAEGLRLQVSTFRTTPVERIIEAVRREGARGLVVLGTELSEAELMAFSALGKPLVFLDTLHESLPFHFVNMNNDDALLAIVAHLADQGHHKIGFVRCSVDFPPHNFKLREKAFRAAMTSRGLPVEESQMFAIGSGFHGARLDMLAILESRRELPTALVCANDLIACGCLQAFQQWGLRVPDDISLVGFDDLPLSSVVDPPLTTIQVPKIRMGQLAIRLLTDQLSREEETPAAKAVISGSLLVRGSVRRIFPEEKHDATP